MADAAADIAPQEKILPALIHHFTPEDPAGEPMSRERLIELLKKLPSLSKEDHVDPVATQLKTHEPSAFFTKEDAAVIAFVDDGITEVLKQTDLDFKIEAFIRSISPALAVLALQSGINDVTRSQPSYELIDLLIEECIGWSEDLGVLGEQYMEKIQAAMAGYFSGRHTTEQCISELNAAYKKEEPLFKKLESRLCERELEVIAGKKAQFFSAELINKEMTGQQLPLFIIFMLQGPWYEFLQQIYMTYGPGSKEWDNGQKMTEALIWSLQPDKDVQKQRSVMQSLPNHVRSLCDKAPFDGDQVVESLADLEAEYEAITRNEPSDPCDFDLMEVDEGMAASLQAATKNDIKKIEQVPVGQWFLYDDPTEPEEKVARIKLILNWKDTEQLLLTNHNRRKVVHMSYAEMVSYQKKSILRTLNPARSAAETVREHLKKVLIAVSDQNKKEKQIEQREERKQVNEEYTTQRKEDLLKQLEQIEQQAKKKKQRAMLLRHKARKKQALAEQTVEGLKQDAWVSLPIMEGTLTPCKLVAIIPGNSTYIFANRAGLKVAEYTASQLAHMIVTENSEILDTGAEFESALATVVSGLREDRNKSYDELTGDTG